MSAFTFVLLLAIPFFCFFFHRLLNLFSVFRSISPTKVALTAILVSMMLVLLLIVILESANSGLPICLLYAAFTAPLLGHLYFQIFNLSETARRIKLLVNLKKLGAFSLEGQYSPQQLVSLRLRRLRDLHQVTYHEGSYSTRLTVLTFAAIALRSLERFVYPRRKQNQVKGEELLYPKHKTKSDH